MTDSLRLDLQKLWLCRWGTMTALVWATSPETARLRVRHQCFDRRATVYKVGTYPRVINGEVLIVREATEADKDLFEEWGGEVPA